MNTVNLIGNLTSNPELRYTTGENPLAVCKFGIAINYGYGDKKETSFLNIVAFGKQAENCDKYLSKGKKVAVTGRIKTGSYEKDGRKIYTTDIVADSVEFLSSTDQSVGNATNSRQNEAQAVPEAYQTAYAHLDDGDIPF